MSDSRLRNHGHDIVTGKTLRGGVMRLVMRDYLKDQAATCLRWARETYDLSTAENLRRMAEEFLAKANELKHEIATIEPAGPVANGSGTDGVATDDARSDGA